MGDGGLVASDHLFFAFIPSPAECGARLFQQGRIQYDNQIRFLRKPANFGGRMAKPGCGNNRRSLTLRAEQRKILSKKPGEKSRPTDNSAREFYSLSGTAMNSNLKHYLRRRNKHARGEYFLSLPYKHFFRVASQVCNFTGVIFALLRKLVGFAY
jgi:hypothetical protein